MGICYIVSTLLKNLGRLGGEEMRKSLVESLDMVVGAVQEALRQADLDEEDLRLLHTRKEEFSRMLIGDILSSIEAITNERLREIFDRSGKLEEESRQGREVVAEAKKLMQDAASAGKHVRERQQRDRLEALIAYWAAALRVRTEEFIVGPHLDPFLPTRVR